MIDRTISRTELAKALRMSPAEFDSVCVALFVLGFPQPEPGDRWRLAELLEWVTTQQEAHMVFVDTVRRFIDVRS